MISLSNLFKYLITLTVKGSFLMLKWNFHISMISVRCETKVSEAAWNPAAEDERW